jgi:hypothetical protein
MADNGDEALQEEVRRLRDERDRLKTEVEQKRGRSRPRLRAVAAAVLVVLVVLLTVVTVPAAWGRRTVLDTDNYIAVIGPLAEDPAIQAVLADRITTQVMSLIDVQSVVGEALPDRAAFLAGPLTDAVQGFVRDKVQAVLASDAFAEIWVDANRFVHQQVLAILDGEGDLISVREGVVLLNLLPLVNLALRSVQSAASGLVGDLPLPEITVGDLPAEAIAKIESTLGVSLPDTFGSIPVYDSNELHDLQVGVRRFERLVYFFLILIPVLFAGALVASARKRRTLLQLIVGMSLAVVIVRRLAIAMTEEVVDRAKPENRDAVRAVTDPLVGSLRSYTAWFLWVAVIALIITLLTGPYPWARSLRANVSSAVRALGAGGEPVTGNPTLRWVSAHRDTVMLLLAGLAAMIFLLTDLGVGASLVVLLVVGAVEALVWLISRPAIPDDIGPTAPAAGSDA